MADPSLFTTPEQIRDAAEAFRADYAAVKAEIAKAVVGHEDVIDGVLTCLFTAGHVLLEGVPGIGKTLLVATLSRALNLDFARVQFTPDLMPADITGTTVVHEIYSQGKTEREFRFAPGPIFAQIVLADEINRATPKTQSAMLEAMQEKSVTVGGTTRALPAPFFVMATQHPIEQEGTYPLPEAQLDRVLFKLVVGYSNRRDLAEILERTATRHTAEISPVLDSSRIMHYQQLVRAVAIAPGVRDYAVRLVLATHPSGSDVPGISQGFSTPLVDAFVRIGASPRAAHALELGSKCRAMRAVRTAGSVDDSSQVALSALRHRRLLNFEGNAEGTTPDTIIEKLE